MAWMIELINTTIQNSVLRERPSKTAYLRNTSTYQCILALRSRTSRLDLSMAAGSVFGLQMRKLAAWPHEAGRRKQESRGHRSGVRGSGHVVRLGVCPQATGAPGHAGSGPALICLGFGPYWFGP